MKKMNWFLPLLAGLLILCGGALTTYLTYGFRKKNINSQEKLTDLNVTIEESVRKVSNANEEILELTLKSGKLLKDLENAQTEISILTEKTEKLATINKVLNENMIKTQVESQDRLTGGDGFAFIQPQINSFNIKKSKFSLVRGGTFTLIGLQVYNGSAKSDFLSSFYYSDRDRYDLGFFDFDLPRSISFSALNGTWDQFFVYEIIGDKYEYCFYVVSQQHPKGKSLILKRYVSPNFPTSRLLKHYEKQWESQIH